MANPWISLRSLLPGPSTTEGVISSIEEDGTIFVTTITGGQLRCSSTIAVQEGQTVAVQDQRIVEIIEDLQTFEITI
jgi:hypothetical protein